MTGALLSWLDHIAVRPITLDAPPVIDKAEHANLWLNSGQASVGWTMSCGSGQVPAGLIWFRKPAIDTDEISIDRYWKAA